MEESIEIAAPAFVSGAASEEDDGLTAAAVAAAPSSPLSLSSSHADYEAQTSSSALAASTATAAAASPPAAASETSTATMAPDANDASVEKANKKWHQRPLIKWVVLLVLLIGVTIGVVVGVLVNKNKNNNDIESNNNAAADANENANVDVNNNDVSEEAEEEGTTTTNINMDEPLTVPADKNENDNAAPPPQPQPRPPTPEAANINIRDPPTLPPIAIAFNNEDTATNNNNYSPTPTISYSNWPTPGWILDGGGGWGDSSQWPTIPVVDIDAILDDDVAFPPPLVEHTCRYQKSSIVVVSAPSYDTLLSSSNGNASGNNASNNITKVEKKLSGGASAAQGNDAIVVSYNVNGTEGAVWSLGRDGSSNSGNNNDNDNENNGGSNSPNNNNPNNNDNNEWSQTSTLQTIHPDQLGWDVSLSGRTFVVGAPGSRGKEIYLNKYGWYWAGRGVAIVMNKNGNNGKWRRVDTLIPGVAEENADFGTSVGVAECECLIAVGAWHDRDSRGSVYIFSNTNGSGGGWTELQKLAPPATRRTQSEYFHGNYGYTVALTDNYLAVRAPYDSYTENEDYFDPFRGVVYVYKKSDDGTAFELHDRLFTPEGSQVRTHLTDMVFVNQFLIVGAPGRNRAYVFELRNTDPDDSDEEHYEKVAELKPSTPVSSDTYFGVSVDAAKESNRVFIGDGGQRTSYLFAYENGVWKEKATFDGFNAAMAGESTIVQHTPKEFEGRDDNGEYGGEVNFYDLVCDE